MTTVTAPRIENANNPSHLNLTSPTHEAVLATEQPPFSGGGGDESEVKTAVDKAGGDVEDNGGATVTTDKVQKRMMRAERFGVPVQLSEQDKRNSRVERLKRPRVTATTSNKHGTTPVLGLGEAERSTKISTFDEQILKKLAKKIKVMKKAPTNIKPRQPPSRTTHAPYPPPIQQVGPRYSPHEANNHESVSPFSPHARDFVTGSEISPSSSCLRRPFNRAMLEQFEAFHSEDRRRSLQDPPIFDPTMPRFNPSWVISETESILHPSSVFIGGQIQKGILFDRDKHEMMSANHHVVEDISQEYISKLGLFVHHLSADISAHKQHLRDAQSTISTMHSEFESLLETERGKVEEASRTLDKERQHWENEKTVLEQRANTLKDECNNAFKELTSLQQEQLTYKNHEYRTIQAKTRIEGARDFLKSITCRDILEGKQADGIIEGFSKAVDYMVQDGFVTQNFNADDFVDKRLTAPSLRISEVIEPIYEIMPEFDVLAADVDENGRSPNDVIMGNSMDEEE